MALFSNINLGSLGAVRPDQLLRKRQPIRPTFGAGGSIEQLRVPSYSREQIERGRELFGRTSISPGGIPSPFSRPVKPFSEEERTQFFAGKQGATSSVVSPGPIKPALATAAPGTQIPGTSITVPGAPITPEPTSITTRAGEVTKSPRDKLLDLLLERASKPFDLERTYKTLREETGMPGLEKTREQFASQIGKVESLLDKIEGDVKERTGGFLTTEAQKRRIEAGEREPLSKELAIQERGLKTTEATLESKRQFVSDMLGLKRETDKSKLDALTKAIELGDKQTELELKARGVDVNELKAQIELMKAPSAEETALGLDKIRAEINKLNADAFKTMKGATGPGKISSQVEKKLLETAGVETLLNQIESMVAPLVFGGGPLSRISGFLRRGVGLTGLDPQVKVYNDFRKGIIGQVARALSQEVGVLTDKDIERADKLLPKVTDTAGEVKLKMQTIRDLIEASKNNLRATASTGAASLLDKSGVVRVQSPEGNVYEYDLDDPELEEALEAGYEML